MKMPFVRLRITAYQSVVASWVPWMRCHGRRGSSERSTTPASTSCFLVAT